MESFETKTATDFDAKKKPHHEDTIAFQGSFSSDTRKFLKRWMLIHFNKNVLKQLECLLYMIMKFTMC